jgi:Flp pilus assembly protein TadD
MRRTKAGGAKKRPTRYEIATAASPALTRGLRAHRKGDYEVAIAAYREALAEDEAQLDAWMNLGAAAVASGRAGDAVRAFERGLALAPSDARAHRDAGIALAAIGRFEASYAHLGRAIALDPTLTGAALFLPRVAGDLGRRDLALRHAREAALAYPSDPSAHLELHRAEFDDGALGPAIAAAARAVDLDPNYALARLFLGAALSIAGDVEASERVLAAPSSGAVAPGLVDAVRWLRSARGTSTRFFAHRRDTVLHALSRSNQAGAVVELGVRHGISLRWLAEQVTSDVHGFDGFDGLPVAWQGREPGAFTTKGELPEMPAHVTLHVGPFEETLPVFTRAHGATLRLLHVDSDLYESARLGLFTLAPRIASGTVIVFDEYVENDSWRRDEHRAFEEACAHFAWKHEIVAASVITGQLAVRIL